MMKFAKKIRNRQRHSFSNDQRKWKIRLKLHCKCGMVSMSLKIYLAISGMKLSILPPREWWYCLMAPINRQPIRDQLIAKQVRQPDGYRCPVRPMRKPWMMSIRNSNRVTCGPKFGTVACQGPLQASPWLVRHQPATNQGPLFFSSPRQKLGAKGQRRVGGWGWGEVFAQNCTPCRGGRDRERESERVRER